MSVNYESGCVLPSENSGLELLTAYAIKHGAEMATITVPDLSVRLETWRMGQFSFYWPTAVNKRYIPDIMCDVGMKIGANSYACDNTHARTWITQPKATQYDMETWEFHSRLLRKVLADDFEGLATKSSADNNLNAADNYLVEWVGAFDQPGLDSGVVARINAAYRPSKPAATRRSRINCVSG